MAMKLLAAVTALWDLAFPVHKKTEKKRKKYFICKL
jgi:hypothetical protein